MADVLADYRQYFTKDKLIISVAAGLTVETLSNYLGFTDQTGRPKIIRTMPNTPYDWRGRRRCILFSAGVC